MPADDDGELKLTEYLKVRFNARVWVNVSWMNMVANIENIRRKLLELSMKVIGGVDSYTYEKTGYNGKCLEGETTSKIAEPRLWILIDPTFIGFLALFEVRWGY